MADYDLPLVNGKKGWPWKVVASEEFNPHHNHNKLPLISIVTPSFNQGRYIEETIRSVLMQGYPNLEYFIIDGGSTDNTLEIIKKYEKWLTGWVSEKDDGQADAVNKGWSRSQGTILGWLNSDDLLCPQALYHIANAFQSTPHPLMIYGDSYTVDSNSCRMQREKNMRDFSLNLLFLGKAMAQPAVFITDSLLKLIGLLDKNLHFGLDFDFFLRAWSTCDTQRFVHVPVFIACTRSHEATKSATGGTKFIEENVLVLQRIWQNNMAGYHGDKVWRAYYARAILRQAQKSMRLHSFRLTIDCFFKAFYWHPFTAMCRIPYVLFAGLRFLRSNGS